MKKSLLIFLGIILIFSIPQISRAGDSLYHFEYLIKSLVGVDSYPDFTDAIIDLFVNQGISEIVSTVNNRCALIERRDTISITKNVYIYNLNSDYVAIRGVYPCTVLAERQALNYISIDAMGKEPTGGLNKAVSFYEIREDNPSKIAFDPVPGQNDRVIIIYNARSNWMTADSMETTLPKDFTMCAVYFTLSQLMYRIDRSDKAGLYLNLYGQLLEQKIQILSNQKYNIQVLPKIIGKQ